MYDIKLIIRTVAILLRKVVEPTRIIENAYHWRKS